MNFASSQVSTSTDIDSAYILLQIIANPETAKQRLDDLVKQTEKMEAAAEVLAGADSIAKIRAELASRERQLAERQAVLETLEADVKDRYAAIAAALA